MRLLTAIAAVVVTFACSDSASGQSLRERRPCGPQRPGFLRLLIPQGFHGADFRPACRRHDACYLYGNNRMVCEQNYRQELFQACENSRCKLGCRLVAHGMSAGTFLFGGFYWTR